MAATEARRRLLHGLVAAGLGSTTVGAAAADPAGFAATLGVPAR